MYTIFLLSKVGNGNKQRTFWNRAGVAFGHNKDGSLNFRLDMFPNLTFQIRENKVQNGNDADREHQAHA